MAIAARRFSTTSVKQTPEVVDKDSHSAIKPAILYWGTPVVLISTENEDGTANIGPMSSAFWLLDRCMIGLETGSQTTINLRRNKQCVLNLPSDDMGDAVNALADTTGTPDVPEGKKARGYRYVKDKFGIAKLTPQASEVVSAPRIRECPVQMEAVLMSERELMEDRPEDLKGYVTVLELRIVKTYVVDDIRMEGKENRIDTDKWRPMIMSFQHLYGLRNGKVKESKLAKVEEELYRVPSRHGEEN